MRHRISGNTLNRKTSHRKATIRDIAKATLINERITTTKCRAKETRKMVDQLITLGKKGTLADKRRAFAILCDHQLVSRLFTKIAPRFDNRAGGYTRIIPIGPRKGDNAEMVFLELTEKEKIILSKQKAGKKSSKVKAVTGTEKDKQKKKSTEKKAKTVKEALDVKAEERHPPKEERAKDKMKDKKPRSFVSGLRKMFNRKNKPNE